MEERFNMGLLYDVCELLKAHGYVPGDTASAAKTLVALHKLTEDFESVNE